MVDATRQRAVDAYFAAIAAMDADALVAAFTPEGISYDPVGAPPHEGPDGLRAFMEGITGTFTEMVLEPEQTYHSGEQVAVHWTARGRSKSGVAVSYAGIDIFEVTDEGRIARMWGYWHPRELFAQLKN